MVLRLLKFYSKLGTGMLLTLADHWPKLIAFLGNYSMYCIRPDPLRASVRVWLRETRHEAEEAVVSSDFS